MPPIRKEKTSRVKGPYSAPNAPFQPALTTPSSSRANRAGNHQGNMLVTGPVANRSLLASQIVADSESSFPQRSHQLISGHRISPQVRLAHGLASQLQESSISRQLDKTLELSSQQTDSVFPSPPSSVGPKTPRNTGFISTRDPVYMRVCGHVTEFGDFNWPLINRLCDLTPSEVISYNTAFFWVHVGLEPILKRPGAKVKKGYWWDGVLRHFNERNPWSCISTGRSLAETYNRYRGNMRSLVKLHNARIERQTIDQRVEATMQFMRLAREQPRSKEDEPGEVKARKLEKMTLCPVECDLIVWYYQEMKDGGMKRIGNLSPAPGPIVDVLPTDFGDETLDDFYQGVKKTLKFRKDVNKVMGWGWPEDDSENEEESGGESESGKLNARKVAGGHMGVRQASGRHAGDRNSGVGKSKGSKNSSPRKPTRVQVAQPKQLPAAFDSSSSDSSNSDTEGRFTWS